MVIDTETTGEISYSVFWANNQRQAEKETKTEYEKMFDGKKILFCALDQMIMKMNQINLTFIICETTIFTRPLLEVVVGERRVMHI